MCLRKSPGLVLNSLILLFVMMFSSSLWGQAVSGTLLGTVTDPTGAVVSGAKVTLVLTGQSTEHTSFTNASGDFTMPNLPPGIYKVTVAATGFKTETRENIELATNTTVRVDVNLQTGSTSETVEVTTAPPDLQTDRADISSTIEKGTIASLPLSSGNSFQSVLNTVPGMAPVVFNNSQFYNANNDLSTNANGQSSYVNLYQIEGIDDDQRTGIHIILVPPAAAIDNVDITTNNFEAEFGRAVGTVVNVTLKSGSNNFHGSAFQNMENNGVNARNYFASGPNGRLVYNYTGGSVGGPVIRNKLFFFGDFLRTSDHESATTNTTIPFYNVVSVAGTSYLSLAEYSGQVYDPTTGDTADCSGASPNASCGTGRTAFAGNLIPMSELKALPSQIGLTVLQDLDALARNPTTNFASAAYLAGATTNNFSMNLPFSKDTTSYDVKSDYTITQKDHLSGRFSHQKINTYQAPLFGAFLGGPANSAFEGTGVAASYSTGFNYDHVFSPTLFTEARFGVAHLRNSATQSDYGKGDATTLGIPGNGPNGTDNTPQASGQVAFSVANFASSSMLIGYSVSLPWLRAESNIDFANNWTNIRGNHTLKAGFDIRRVRDDLLQGNINAAAGEFYFNEKTTSIPVGAASFNGASTGQANDVASELFDVPYQVGQDTNSTFPCFRQTWLFFFVSDKWQLNHKMTLDLGLRYELYPPATPRKAGGFVNYIPTNDTLVIAGVDGNPSNLGMQTDYRNLAPRLGLSYRVSEQTVLRAGFGISYVPFVDNSYAYNYPIKTSTDYNSSQNYGPALNNGAIVNYQTGVPITPTPAFTSSGTLTETAANGTLALGNLLIPLNFKNAYVDSWNTAIEQTLPKNMTLQIAYVANHGTRIDLAQNINYPSIYGQGGSYDPFNIAFGKTASVTQYFLGFSSNYESLQTQLTRRFTNGLATMTAFTWGKAQGYQTGAQDGGLLYFSGNWRRNYNLLDFDRTKNFEQTVTYELPFGKGHRLLNSGIGAYTVGGWKLSAIISAVSGTPYTISTTSATSGTTQTVNMTGSYNVTHSVSRAANTAWFDPTQFAAPAACTAYSASNPVACALGNTQRNQFRGPAYFSDNLSISKSFSLYHETKAEFRFDAFNMTNTPAFSNPNGTLGSNLGKISSTLGSGVGNVNGVGGPRVLQASFKYTF